MLLLSVTIHHLHYYIRCNKHSLYTISYALIKPCLIKATTINNICHANKDIIRLTETLRTSLLTLANSIYINIEKTISV